MLIFGLFLAMLFYFLYVASRQQNELMDSNYYKEEIEFQQKIDASERLNKAYDKPLISRQNRLVEIRIPREMAQRLVSGDIEFIHHSLREADLKLAFRPDTSGIQIVPDSQFKSKGSYKCRILWKDDSGSYYREEDLSF